MSYWESRTQDTDEDRDELHGFVHIQADLDAGALFLGCVFVCGRHPHWYKENAEPAPKPSQGRPALLFRALSRSLLDGNARGRKTMITKRKIHHEFARTRNCNRIDMG